ncbi:MAG: hypothetical protein LBU32_10700 [Clostridiales bacterium]|nr:hypothetical protein [Clostridiales bacterium]
MDDPYAWRASTIIGMPAKPECAGHASYFRTYKPSFMSKPKKFNPQEN